MVRDFVQSKNTYCLTNHVYLIYYDAKMAISIAILAFVMSFIIGHNPTVRRIQQTDEYLY